MCFGTTTCAVDKTGNLNWATKELNKDGSRSEDIREITAASDFLDEKAWNVKLNRMSTEQPYPNTENKHQIWVKIAFGNWITQQLAAV